MNCKTKNCKNIAIMSNTNTLSKVEFYCENHAREMAGLLHQDYLNAEGTWKEMCFLKLKFFVKEFNKQVCKYKNTYYSDCFCITIFDLEHADKL